MSDNDLKQEYRDGTRLGQRLNLHDLFSINPRGWHLWVFDQFEFPAHCQILELGCGPGRLWQRNLGRIPQGWQITLSDFSPGMLAEARNNLQDTEIFKFAAIEAQTIPFTSNSLDVIIANHMLYHVPDRERAYREIYRVLKPGGQLYAATNGQFTMRQYDELVLKFSPESQLRNPKIIKDYFCLENGYTELSQWFAPVSERRYEDALVVTEAGPLAAYVESSGHLGSQALLELQQYVEEVIRLEGAFHIDKIVGILIATKS